MSHPSTVLRTEYVCSCFFKYQIFIKKYGLHVCYDNDVQFEADFRQSLRFRGCSTDKQYTDVLSQVKGEVERRKNYHSRFLSNYLRNREYRYVYPELVQLQTSHLDCRFLDMMQEKNLQNADTLLHSLVNHGGHVHGQQVYSFPIFTEEFCKHLSEELENFKQSTKERSLPNTMNFEGVSLDEMGLSYTLLTALIKAYLQPITKLLFPDWGGGAIDSFKSFAVHYEADKYPSLSKHFDNAEISLSICLNSNFTGGELQLEQMLGQEEADLDMEPVVVQQKVGQCIMHRSRQFHFAHPITSGVRTNMIVWMRSSSIRNEMCPMCGHSPDIQEVPIAGDGFTLGQGNPACSWL
ncbi:2-oxoglutarate and iron-dependent oxygenase domain-containing protein 2 [Elysia marginata]|uniref:2-oxoglutarate and iron-dependent oxygenase domain-containing protein 2 n=1 Tax=Elysia marginata TaxID=1093978 RepID=A0AAV4J3W8_9GAST|nr:2-oxoglutarate and iron-dependent oxygenase domain-containing protein 2 [Elysia marginata]